MRSRCVCVFVVALLAACGGRRTPGDRDRDTASDEDVVPGDDSPPSDLDRLPGPVTVAETTLEMPVVEAGAPVRVRCAAFDAAGLEVTDARASGVDAPAAVEVETALTDGFRLRATELGDFDLACRYGDVVDASPARLTVTVGVPRNSETSVEPSTVRPGETVTVTCAVTDAYGNARDDVSAAVAVLPASESSGSDGLAVDGDTFSATRAGDYDVFCAVPGFDAGDESPARVTVLPGDACSWVVDRVDEDCYAQGRRAPVDVTVLDCFGNTVPSPLVQLGSTPGNAVWDPEGGIVFPDEAVYDVELTYGGVQDPSSDIAPWLETFVVDSTPPRWSIAGPQRAGMLQEGTLGVSAVGVSGGVWDPVSPIAALSVNDVVVPVSGTQLAEGILTTMQSEWGLSVLTGGTADECGNRAVIAQSFLRSPSYFPASTVADTSARVPQGILAQLNQPVIDDYQRADIDDVATLGQTVLGAMDPNTLVAPGDVLAEEGLRDASGSNCEFCDWWTDTAYRVRRHPDGARRLTWLGPDILSLTAVQGGIAFDIRAEAISVPLEMRGQLRECACGADATQTVTVDATAGADSVRVTGLLGVSLAGGAPAVTASNVNVQSTGLFFDVDCWGILDYVCDAATGAVISTFQSLIEDALAAIVESELPPLVEDVLGGFNIDSSFSTPEPIAATISLSSGFDRLLACGPTSALAKPAGCPAINPASGFLNMGLGAQVFAATRGADISPAALGAIRRDGTLAAFSSSAYTFGFGLKDDLLNQALWALWYGGALDIPDLSALAGSLGVPGVSLSFSALLPPVIMPGAGDFPSRIGVGDAYIEASVDLVQALGGEASEAGTIDISLYMSTIVGASIDIDPTTNEILIALDPSPEVYVQVADIDDPQYQAVMSELFTGLLRLLLPELLGSALGSFPVPSIDLSGVAGLPAGTVWELDNGEVARSGAYYRFTGSLK